MRRCRDLVTRSAAVLLLLSLSLACARGAAARSSQGLPTQAMRPSIVAVGDGLTEGAFARKHDGWGLLLAERYTRKVRACARAHACACVRARVRLLARAPGRAWHGCPTSARAPMPLHPPTPAATRPT
jgi:hypothetical protein